MQSCMQREMQVLDQLQLLSTEMLNFFSQLEKQQREAGGRYL